MRCQEESRIKRIGQSSVGLRMTELAFWGMLSSVKHWLHPRFSWIPYTSHIQTLVRKHNFSTADHKPNRQLLLLYYSAFQFSRVTPTTKHTPLIEKGLNFSWRFYHLEMQDAAHFRARSYYQKGKENIFHLFLHYLPTEITP